MLFRDHSEGTQMAKQVLKHLDLAALSVALDHAEEHGLTTKIPDPAEHPVMCVYLKYVGTEQAELLARRLPHVTILLRTPAGAGRNKKLIPVFDREAIEHILDFLMPSGEGSGSWRTLDTVDKKYWKVV
jgi:hypothetical protein